ncbi:sensor histidine kinase [Pseudidiomarina taiwanensis]|uniref:Signal transduction histidine kinase subgroup 3 dimerisation and phosphoacceptor domain-containing protein n=1 Tax=Pseudidiomarina taiwanensis TaxID=337250 RepID=A0A432ZCK2_9GAMM|nr:histidine kinase [Pseudidiomarina taiwanensis]RUO75629.1 hypothetical protein CWI83_09610 [Pseudidiomarina taiwanensis]
MKRKKLNFKITSDQLSGLGTVVLVGGIDLWSLVTFQDLSPTVIFSLASCYFVFALLFSLLTSNDELTGKDKTTWLLLIGQFLAVNLVMYISPNMFTAILLVIWMAQLPYIMPFKLALWLSPLLTAIAWYSHAIAWGGDTLIFNALLFYSFNIFAMLMMESRRNAEFQTERAERGNRELVAMQSLMQEASKQDERLRIARDIHDLVGHHLTALTLQLQVLGRTVPETSKKEVEQTHAIAKLLLADVREAVSDIREHDYLDLKVALSQISERIQGVKVLLDIPERVAVLDLKQGMAVLRGVQEAITNSVRHGRANEVRIEVRQNKELLTVCVEDNGSSSKPFIAGNGITGMTERFEQLRGHVQAGPSEKGFVVKLVLPLMRTS